MLALMDSPTRHGPSNVASACTPILRAERELRQSIHFDSACSLRRLIGAARRLQWKVAVPQPKPPSGCALEETVNHHIFAFVCLYVAGCSNVIGSARLNDGNQLEIAGYGSKAAISVKCLSAAQIKQLTGSLIDPSVRLPPVIQSCL